MKKKKDIKNVKTPGNETFAKCSFQQDILCHLIIHLISI